MEEGTLATAPLDEQQVEGTVAAASHDKQQEEGSVAAASHNAQQVEGTVAAVALDKQKDAATAFVEEDTMAVVPLKKEKGEDKMIVAYLKECTQATGSHVDDTMSIVPLEEEGEHTKILANLKEEDTLATVPHECDTISVAPLEEVTLATFYLNEEEAVTTMPHDEDTADALLIEGEDGVGAALEVGEGTRLAQGALPPASSLPGLQLLAETAVRRQKAYVDPQPGLLRSQSFQDRCTPTYRSLCPPGRRRVSPVSRQPGDEARRGRPTAEVSSRPASSPTFRTLQDLRQQGGRPMTSRCIECGLSFHSRVGFAIHFWEQSCGNSRHSRNYSRCSTQRTDWRDHLEVPAAVASYPLGDVATAHPCCSGDTRLHSPHPPRPATPRPLHPSVTGPFQLPTPQLVQLSVSRPARTSISRLLHPSTSGSVYSSVTGPVQHSVPGPVQLSWSECVIRLYTLDPARPSFPGSHRSSFSVPVHSSATGPTQCNAPGPVHTSPRLFYQSPRPPRSFNSGVLHSSASEPIPGSVPPSLGSAYPSIHGNVQYTHPEPVQYTNSEPVFPLLGPSYSSPRHVQRSTPGSTQYTTPGSAYRTAGALYPTSPTQHTAVTVSPQPAQALVSVSMYRSVPWHTPTTLPEPPCSSTPLPRHPSPGPLHNSAIRNDHSNIRGFLTNPRLQPYGLAVSDVAIETEDVDRSLTSVDQDIDVDLTGFCHQ